MAIKHTRGFALLIAVVFSSVLLALGVALSSLAYKQQILASTGVRSQYAFYAAEAAFECAMLQAQKSDATNPYRYENHLVANPKPECPDSSFPPSYFTELCYNGIPSSICGANERVVKQLFPIAFPNPLLRTSGDETLCAEVIVYEKQNKPVDSTFVFAQGYDVPCNKVGTTNRIVARGIYVQF